MGFSVAYEEDIPMGKYWMNDYVMRKDCNLKVTVNKNAGIIPGVQN